MDALQRLQRSVKAGLVNRSQPREITPKNLQRGIETNTGVQGVVDQGERFIQFRWCHRQKVAQAEAAAEVLVEVLQQIDCHLDALPIGFGKVRDGVACGDVQRSPLIHVAVRPSLLALA